MMRIGTGDIPPSGGGALSLLAEQREVATTTGHDPRPIFGESATGMPRKEGSPLTASMPRGTDRGTTEGEAVMSGMESARRP